MCSKNRVFVFLMTVGIVISAIVPLYAQDQDGNGMGMGNGGNKITICHATGSASNPYVEITVSVNAAGDHGHGGHDGDIIPAPPEGCPTGEGNTKPDRITLCHATGSADNPYEQLTVSYNAATEGHGHEDHAGDIIPAPAEGCPVTADALDWITLCHATGSEDNPYEQLTISYDAATEGHGHEDHTGDIIPAPAEGCPDASPPSEIPTLVPEPSTCPDWLVYSTNVTGDWELFRLGELPDNPAADPNLTKGVGFIDADASLSPGHDWITFASNRDGNWEIYIGSADGMRQQRITRNARADDLDPVWSPGGEYIVFESTRDGNWELYLFNITNGAFNRLTNDPARDVNAFWSPDGTHLLFQSDRDGRWQIYELDIVTLETRQISDGLADDREAAYSFDGTRMVFRSNRDTTNSIYMMRLDGGSLTRISDPAGNALNPVWSPDDALIAYQSNLDGDMDVYVYELATGKTRLVTDNTVGDYAPTWMCSGSMLVFTSDVSGNPDIFNTPALPIDAVPVIVDSQAVRMTSDPAVERYPLNTPSEENATRLSAMPNPGG